NAPCLSDGICDDREDTDAECSDGVDNDGDTRQDCAVYSCNRNADVTVCNAEVTDALCSDGIDNDDNGYTDCEDFGCHDIISVTICCI
ncbi:MAG: hypothetical protein JRG91_21065, partial [Deltaproteobacteria bacterium]|nr:hypothetical protein [Deltaproteobacteria bacterium]